MIAIKVLNLDTEEDDVDDIQKEISLLSQLTHVKSQNITPYYGSFLNDAKLWIIMEYAAGGSVRTIVNYKPCCIDFMIKQKTFFAPFPPPFFFFKPFLL